MVAHDENAIFYDDPTSTSTFKNTNIFKLVVF